VIETELTTEPGESLEDNPRIALDCYLSSLVTFAECVEAACPPVGAQYYEQIVRIRRRLLFNSNQATLEGTRDSIESTLTAYAEQAQRYCELRSEEREGVLALLSQIEESAGEKAAVITPLAEEIRKRLIPQQDMVTVDALTGLVNRRELERQVKLRIATGKQFCVLFFDIDDFKIFNETLGHEAGDQVLKQVAERMSTQIRARDLACRWLADEFIVVLDCDLENARRRSTQMAKALRGPYTIEEEGRPANLEIRLSAAATECGPGDTPRKIWLRLEEDFNLQNNTAAVA
jgi:diguanylate cyclase (GGDEF)-like protein